MPTLARLDQQFVWHPFTQMRDWLKREPIVIVAGSGAVLRDARGREYLDANREPVYLTGAKGMVGTPSFMPPEAIRNDVRSDPRSDIYSVGALGYYLLTAAYVFDAENVLTLYEKHLNESPIPPSQRSKNPVSAELEETLLRCLKKEPNLRPQSVNELSALLLTSPRASDWGPGPLAAWWARYHAQEILRPGETDRARRAHHNLRANV